MASVRADGVFMVGCWIVTPLFSLQNFIPLENHNPDQQLLDYCHLRFRGLSKLNQFKLPCFQNNALKMLQTHMDFLLSHQFLKNSTGSLCFKNVTLVYKLCRLEIFRRTLILCGYNTIRWQKA